MAQMAQYLQFLLAMWRLNEMKTIFWNVDTQYDFMRDDQEHRGTLALPGAKLIEPNLKQLTEFAAYKGIQVVNTADWHTPQSRELSANPDYKTTFPHHCMQHTRGAEFVPATKPERPYIIDWQTATFDQEEVRAHRNVVLYKDAFDIFAGSPHTDDVLHILQPDRAIVYGVATNVCVDFAVKGLLERKIAVEIPIDSIKEIPGPIDHILRGWEALGAKLRTTDEIIKLYR